MGRIGKKTIEDVVKYLERQPHAMTRQKIAHHIGRSLDCTGRILATLSQQNIIASKAGTNEQGRYTYLYWPMGLKFVPPPDMNFTETLPRPKLRGGKTSQSDQIKRVFKSATQQGFERPWYLRCLFGDGPAHQEVTA